jgi:class 3 adenylate cyclase/outer membrane protein assembly factor BamB
MTSVPQAQTRGFLFADLRGYTAYVEAQGDNAASELLRAYRGIVREQVAAFAGAEIRTEGDGFYVVFPSATSAVNCGLAIQQAAAASSEADPTRSIRVGIGVHAGETADTSEGFVGSAVNIAARVCSVARPGELLVTETVRSLIRTSMPFAFVPRGRPHLKGIHEPVRVYAVLASRDRPASRIARWRRVGTRRGGLLLLGSIATIAIVAAGLAAVTLRGSRASPSTSVTPPSTAKDVAMFRGGLGRTNTMPGPAPLGGLVVRWQFRTPSDMAASPIVADGKVFAGGRDGTVHVVDLATGREDWSFATRSSITSSPAVAQNTLYITSTDGVFHAVDISTHRERWRVTGASPGSVATVNGDTAYVGLAAGRFAALATADGRERWHVDVSGDASRNAIAGGTAYVDGEGSDSVYAIDLGSGTIRWQMRIGTAQVITPAVAEGTVYVVGIDPAGKDSHLAAIDAATGALRWRFAPPSRGSLGTLAVGPTLVFTSTEIPTGTSLFAVDQQSGKLSWTVSLSDGPIAHPAIVGDRLFVASGTGVIHELDAANGTETSKVAIGGPAVGGPIVTGGLVVTGSAAGSSAPGSLWAIGSDSGATASEAPIPVTWLTDLKAPDDKPTLYLNVAVDSRGNIYATDRFNDRIVVWDPAGRLTIWGKRGRGPGEFDFSEVTLGDQSMSVGVAPDGRIAVGDGGNHRVQIFDANLRFLRAIGREGTGPGQFINPCCLVFDPQGRLYVADPGRDDIQVFDKGGTFIRAVGSSGSGNGQFRRLGVPFIDPATGNIWVPDFANRRVEVVAPDGTFVASYGDGQNGNPQLETVNGVVLDKAGRMFVVDTNNFLWVLDPSGNTLWRLGPDFPGAGHVAPPYLLLTGDGKIYLPDTTLGNNRIAVLQLQAPLWPPP